MAYLERRSRSHVLNAIRFRILFTDTNTRMKGSIIHRGVNRQGGRP